MSTVLDLITASLLDLGAIASGEAPTAAESADAFRALNLLLESWRLEALLVYGIDTVTKVMTGATSYTWGAGGDINATRPIHLERAVQRLAGTSPALDLSLQVLNDAEYESIGLKGLQSTIAGWVYLDRAYPLASLFTWPVLPSGDTLLLYVWHPLTAFGALTTTVALPPGYERALQKNLSVELAPSYRDCQITPALGAMAVESKALLKTANNRPRFLSLPAGLPTGWRMGGTSRAAFLSGGNR